MIKRVGVVFLILLICSLSGFAQEFEATATADEEGVTVEVSTGGETEEAVDPKLAAEAEAAGEETSAGEGTGTDEGAADTAQGGETLDPYYKRAAETFISGDVQFVNSDCYFKLDSTDEGTGVNRVEYSINGAEYMEYHNPFNLLKEGNTIINYRGIDNGDNVEDAKIFQVYVDNTAPVVLVGTDRETYDDGAVNFCSPKTRFYIDSKDNPSGAGIKMSYGGFSPDSMSAKGKGTRIEENFFSMTEEGPKELYFTALDNVGNMQDIQQYLVTVDATAPEVFLVQNNNLKQRNGEFITIPSDEVMSDDGRYIVTDQTKLAFTAKDSLSGVSAIYVKVNNEEFVKYFKPIDLKSASEYTILVKTEDNVGNISEPVTFQFVVDYTGPRSTIEVISSQGGSVDIVTE